MNRGFNGDVVDFYHRYRRGYPAAVIDSLVASFGLSDSDVVLDLGCGTGQLTLPMAGRVRSAVGVDPEPDMLERARRAALERGVHNVTWMLGSDAEIPAVTALLSGRSVPEQVGAVTIGQALHWMDHERLFQVLAPTFRQGGGIAVVANGTPLWLQNSAWSRALRGWLERWLETPLVATCGTDEASRKRYRESLSTAGFEVSETRVDYTDELDVERIVGGLYSAMASDQLPAPERRSSFAEELRTVLEPHRPFVERVSVAILTGRVDLGFGVTPSAEVDTR